MIPSALGFLSRLKARLLQQLASPAPRSGAAGASSAQIIGMLREAVIIEQQSRSFADVHRELRLGPMRRD